MKAYLVTDGEYEVLTKTICTSMEQALVAKKHHDAHNPIEIWEMDKPEQEPEYQPRYWRVWLWEDGHVFSATQDGPPIDEEEPESSIASGDMYVLFVKANSEEEAVKLAQEKRHKDFPKGTS